jgi:hypothetical protein
MEKARGYKKQEAATPVDFIRPMGVDIVKRPELLSQEEFDKILDECNLQRRDKKPKESFQIEEWMLQTLRDKSIILPRIDITT